MSDLIHRLVAHAQALPDGSRALQPRPDWQLLPDVSGPIDGIAEAESIGAEASIPQPSSATARERPASRTAGAAPPAAAVSTVATPELVERRPTRGESPAVAVHAPTASHAARVESAPVESSARPPASMQTSATRTHAARPEPESEPEPRSAREPEPAVSIGRAGPSDLPRLARHAETARPAQTPTVAPAAAARSATSRPVAPVIPRVMLATAADLGSVPTGRRAAAAVEGREAARIAESPTVHVTIGRLEILAPRAPQPLSRARDPQRTGLHDYLRARAAGEGR